MKSSMSAWLTTLLFLTGACRNSNDTFTPIILGVSSVNAPSTIASGISLGVTLNVQVGGCLVFDHLEVLRSKSEATMVAWGRDITEGIKDRGIACTRIVDEPHQYSFNPPFGSTFTLTVSRGRLSPLVTTVAVE